MLILRSMVPMLALMALLTGASFCAEGSKDDEAATPTKLVLLSGLPKVPSRETIAGTDEKDTTKVTDWLQNFVAGKESRAKKELEDIRTKLREEARKQAAADRERRRRQGRTPADTAGPNGPSGMRVVLDFQVPEIEAYRRIAEVCLARKALADDISKALSRLDRDSDSKLTGDEYREAAAIINGSSALFQKLDRKEPGFISEEDMAAAANLPKDADAAVQVGMGAQFGPKDRIKPFDANGDGILDISERKALTMAYVDIALRAGKDAEFYKSIADNLAVSRAVLASKYADVEVTQ